VIILIPKDDIAKTLKKFRPISLINCSFKIFSKILNNRLEKTRGRLLAPNQTAFVRERYILESVVATHEIVHDVVKNNQHGVVLKLDYEKAYDRVNWQFLEEMLHSRGFGYKWISWIMRVVKGGSITVKINDLTSEYFKTGKGLRQGNPLSPLLFNLIIDVFSWMLVKAASRGYITGFMGAMCPEGVISLQYADNILLFLNHDFNEACHLKWLMMYFEHLSGMKINYHKSDLTPINLDPEDIKRYS
jgi:hypothetical protein